MTFDGLAVDTDLRWTLLTGLARGRPRRRPTGSTAELERDNTISGQEHAAAARAARPTAEAKAEAWEAAMVRDDIPNETQRSIVLAFQQHGQDEVLAPYVEQYLAAADTMWEEKGTQRASTALEYIFPRPLASQELLDRVDAWLESSPANPAAKRYVREGRADVARALAAQAKDADGRELTAESADPSSVDDGSASFRVRKRRVGVLLRQEATGRRQASVWRVCGARAWSASISMPRLRPPTRSPCGEAAAHLEDRQLDLRVGERAADVRRR